jgi:hypothetical protein
MRPEEDCSQNRIGRETAFSSCGNSLGFAHGGKEAQPAGGCNRITLNQIFDGPKFPRDNFGILS